MPANSTKTPSRINFLRKKIDRLDISILKLLKKRFSTTDEIQAEKRKHKMPILQKGRERALLQTYLKFAESNGLPGALTLKIFRAIFSYSKKSGTINRTK